MSFLTLFDGEADAVVGPPDFSIAYYPSNNFARLTGTGGLKVLNRGASQAGFHVRDSGFADHFVEVVLGTDFSAAGSVKLIVFRADSTGFAGYNVYWYLPSNSVYLAAGGSNVANFGQVLVPGDRLRAQAVGSEIKIFVNNILRLTFPGATNITRSYVGFRAEATFNTGEVLRSWETGAYVPPDLTAPAVSSLDLVSTGPDTLTGTFNSTEAGTADIVLFLDSLADPSDTQVGLGQTVNGSPATIFIDDFPMVVGANSVYFTDVSPNTSYRYKLVPRDGAPTPNVAAGLASPAATTAQTSTPPTIAISTQSIVGQTLSMSGTYTGIPASSTLYLPALSSESEAVDVGPVPLTIGSGSWSVVLEGLTPGDYAEPQLLMSNFAGSDGEFGTAFTIMSITGSPEYGEEEVPVPPVTPKRRILLLN